MSLIWPKIKCITQTARKLPPSLSAPGPRLISNCGSQEFSGLADNWAANRRRARAQSSTRNWRLAVRGYWYHALSVYRRHNPHNAVDVNMGYTSGEFRASTQPQSIE